MLLISGASGAGKTSVRETIACDLAPDVEAVELRHLGTVPAHMPHVLPTCGWDGMVWPRLTTLPWQITVIDGSSMTVAEAGRAALQWVQDALSGRAPVFRRCR